MSDPWFDPNLYAWIPGTAFGVTGGLWGGLAGTLAPAGPPAGGWCSAAAAGCC